MIRDTRGLVLGVNCIRVQRSSGSMCSRINFVCSRIYKYELCIRRMLWRSRRMC